METEIKIDQNLIDGLEKMMDFVVKMKPNHLFYMDNYRKCVIGCYLNNEYWRSKELVVLKDIFGIPVDKFSDQWLFSEETETQKYFTESEYEVISLFTNKISTKSSFGVLNFLDSIEAWEWLVKADEVLTKLKGAK